MLNDLAKRLETLQARFAARYARLFSIDEIRREPVLQWMFGASLFYFFVSFYSWIGRTSITVETADRGAICWPFFRDCADYYFLQTHPFGYSQSILYMFLYGVMALIVYRMWRTEWVQAHALLALLLAWKLIVIALSFPISGPYDYYHIVLTSVLLFAAYKEYFLKLSFVVMYFMSATIKFSDAWILGTYFTSMEDGLPMIPDALVPIVTNIVIFVQVVECWFLLSSNRVLQRISFAFAAFFHLYSGILVSFNYPSVALPPVLILFGPLYRHTPTPFAWKAVTGWLVIAALALFQLLGFVVSPDRFSTLEGHRYGMFMFEANHQCVITVDVHSTRSAPASSWSGMQCRGFYCDTERSVTPGDGETVYTRRMESATAWNRCDPYEIWSRLKTSCDDPATTRIAMRFDHSVNGGPFYRQIDEASVCDLTYKPFSHNSWIKTPEESPIVGYPVENFYSL